MIGKRNFLQPIFLILFLITTTSSISSTIACMVALRSLVKGPFPEFYFLASVIVSFLVSLAGSSVIWSSLSSLVIKPLLGSFSGSLLWSSVIGSSLGSSVIRSSLMSWVLGLSPGSWVLVFCYAILSERIISGSSERRSSLMFWVLGTTVVSSFLSFRYAVCYQLHQQLARFCIDFLFRYFLSNGFFLFFP